MCTVVLTAAAGDGYILVMCTVMLSKVVVLTVGEVVFCAFARQVVHPDLALPCWILLM